MIVKGKAHIVGDNIDTDQIIPARRCVVHDPELLKPYFMEDFMPDLKSKISEGDILFAGENFGHGSSREHAPVVIQAVGIKCIVAASFARIFFRNSTNIGLPAITCPEAVRSVKANSIASIDLTRGIVILESGCEIRFASLPDFMQDIIRKGGLVNFVSSSLNSQDCSR